MSNVQKAEGKTAVKTKRVNGGKLGLIDQRQVRFFQYFLDSESETFRNVAMSALRAGFSKTYSENLTSVVPRWLVDNVGSDEIVQKAESNMKDILALPTDPKNAKATAIMADMTKFALERLSKKKYGKAEGDPDRPMKDDIKRLEVTIRHIITPQEALPDGETR